jgi:hypothetical protein
MFGGKLKRNSASANVEKTTDEVAFGVRRIPEELGG